MKKINVLMLAVVVSIIGFFGSCTKDSNNLDLSITAYVNGTIQDAVTVGSGTDVPCIFNVNAPGKLKTIVLTKKVGANTTTELNKTTSFLKDTFDIVNYTALNVTATTELTLTVTDKNDVVTSKTVTITVSATAPKLSFWTGTLAAQLGASSNTTLGSSYATSTNNVYLSAAASTNSANVDFYYFYNATDGAVAAEVMSPYFAGGTGGISSVTAWTTKNATKFGTTTLTAANFDAIVATDDSQVITAATSLTADRIVTLAIGNVFAFQTAGGKKGLAKVTALTTGVSGSITLEIKVQK